MPSGGRQNGDGLLFLEQCGWDMMRVAPTERYRNFIQQQKHRCIWQLIRLRNQYIKSIPKWRRPLVGYFCAIPIVLLTLFVTSLLRQILHHLIFPGSFLVVSLLLIALMWGVGPALFMLIISMIAVEFHVVIPVGQIVLMNGEDTVQLLLPFMSGLIILLVAGQRERAYINAHLDEQELERYASELEAMNGCLEEANRERDSLVSIASHELKTPITAIRGQSQLQLRRLAKRSTMDIKEVKASFERINEQTTRLTTLIDELLDVNNFRSNGVVLNKSRYDLNQLCRKVIEDQCLLTGRDVTFYPLLEPLELQMDVDRMTQVVINLVSNALKYSPEDRPVEVRVSRNGLQVQDHGCGIAPDELSHIFEMFYRAPRVRSSAIQGLGLGLAISKNIVEGHGGRIWCESELDVGTTFFIELP